MQQECATGQSQKLCGCQTQVRLSDTGQQSKNLQKLKVCRGLILRNLARATSWPFSPLDNRNLQFLRKVMRAFAMSTDLRWIDRSDLAGSEPCSIVKRFAGINFHMLQFVDAPLPGKH